MGGEPEDQRKGDAEDETSDDRKVKGSAFAVMNNVPGKTAKAEGKLGSEGEERAEKDEEGAESKKSAAQVAERVHGKSVRSTGRRVKEDRAKMRWLRSVAGAKDLRMTRGCDCSAGAPQCSGPACSNWAPRVQENLWKQWVRRRRCGASGPAARRWIQRRW